MKKALILTIVFGLLIALAIPVMAVDQIELRKRIGRNQQIIQQITAEIQKGHIEIQQRRGVIAAFSEILAELEDEEEAIKEGKELNEEAIEEKLADDAALLKLEEEVAAGLSKIKADLEKK